MRRFCVFLTLLTAAAVNCNQFSSEAELAQRLVAMRVSDWYIPTFVYIAHASRNDMNSDACGTFGLRSEVWISICPELSGSSCGERTLQQDVKCLLKITEINEKSKLINLKRQFFSYFDIADSFNLWSSLQFNLTQRESENPSKNTPVTYVTCSSSAGPVTNVILLINAIALVGLVAVAYTMLRQQKGISYFNKKLSQNPLLSLRDGNI